jgi:mitogen-activated protein kinase kinase
MQLIVVDAKPAVRKQILRELQIMHDCASPYIVGYYGCYPKDVHVGVVMEYMNAGSVPRSSVLWLGLELTLRSLDYIYRKNGPVPIDMVGKVAEAVLNGLVYLYDVHRIIHRGEPRPLGP